MRLDNYSVAAFEAFEPVDPVEPEGRSPGHGAASESPHPEPVVVEESPSRLLREMAEQPPPVRLAPVHEAPAPGVASAPAPTPVEATAPVAAPAVAPPPAVAVADVASVPLPLGPAVSPDWLNQRETALQAVKADFDAARAAARSAPPADVARAAGSGWVAAPTDADGNPVNGAVFVPDAAAAAAAPEVVPAWMLREGMAPAAPAGQWLSFDDGAFEQSYRERLAARPEASAPLAKLAQLYGEPVQGVLASHPELWTLATHDHALNAGPPPKPGVAMGDALSLGQLDLYLADPFITQLRTQLGGPPAAPTSALALEQQRLYGAERYAQLTQLSQAMAAVRQAHAAAMQAARDGGGIGWVEKPLQFGTDPETGWPTGVYQTVDHGDSSEIVRDANGVPLLATQRVFDEALFTNNWLAQGGLAQEAFGRFYGQAHSNLSLQQDSSESGGPPRWVSQPGLDNPHVALGDSGVLDGDVIALDLNRAPKLNNDGAIGFDPQLGWVTSRDNLYQHRDWFERAMPVVMVAFVGWATAGAGMAAGWGTVGSAAAAGAAASFAGGVINGNLSLKGVLIGAVSGALTAGLTPRLTDALAGAGLGPAAGVAARMTVQGGIQALLGGKFKDGAIAGFASGLAELTSANVGESIKKAVDAGTMTDAEAMAARTFNTMLGSAIRAAGSPDDPAHAFAQDWLGSLMQEQLPAPRPTQGQGPASAVDHRNGSDIESDQAGEVKVYPVPAPGAVEVTPLPPAPLPPDPFLLPPLEGDWTIADEIADRLGVPREDVVNVGWRDDASRSLEVLHGFAEGAGFSILEMGESLLEVAKNPVQFMRGIKALLTSPEARAQLGEALVRKIEVDVRMLQDAFEAGNMRETGQQLGKITTDLAQLAGGVEAVAKLGITTASAGGRVVLSAVDALAERMARNAGLFDAAGNALMDFRSLSSTQKQVIGEVMGAETVQRLVPDAQRVGRVPAVGETGIDDLYRVGRPNVDYVVVEYKFGSSKLGQTLDGVQMSDSWLTGTNTGASRILKAVDGDVSLARNISASLDAGRVERWVVHTDPLGNVTVGMVDAQGKFIGRPSSLVLNGGH